MTLNKRLEAELRAYDPLLRVHWNPGICRWQVFRLRRGLQLQGRINGGRLWLVVYTPLLIFTVRNADKSYRPFDRRVLEALKLDDTHRLNRYADPADELEAIFREKDARGERERNQRLEDIGREFQKDAKPHEEELIESFRRK